jgi:hypothetical protein
MTALVTMFVISLALLGFRFYRLIQYGRATDHPSAANELRVIYINIVINMVFFLVNLAICLGFLSAITGWEFF